MTIIFWTVVFIYLAHAYRIFQQDRHIKAAVNKANLEMETL